MYDTIKIKDRKMTKIIAHRGLSGLECENTAAAFVAAGNRSYYGIETDAHPTPDGVFALIHDASTSRVSGGVDTNVETHPFSDVSELRLLDKIDRQSRRDLVLPVLSEYIRICRKYGKKAILELKESWSAELCRRAVDLLRQDMYLDETVFISFSRESLTNMRALLPEAKMQYLTSCIDEELFSFLAEHRFDLDAGHTSLSADTVARVHALGLEVNCWTVDDPARAEEMIAMGVDYLTTNILE